jgi:hypothetical protein
MLSQTPQPVTSSTAVPSTEVEFPYTRLTALLNLVADNPSTVEPLIHELRGAKFFVPVDGNDPSPLEESCVFCNEREGKLFGIAFLRERDAHDYFREYGQPFHLMMCQGNDLVSTLVKRDPPLGLYLVDEGNGYFLNADLMAIGATILDFKSAEVEHIQYAPSPYTAPIPKQLLTELALFCSQHPHIERIYLSEILSEKGSHGASFIIVGDHQASRVNVQDILSVIADRVGVVDWKGTITWIKQEDGEDILRRKNIDLVYSQKT